MPAQRYVQEISSAAMPAAKRSAGVKLEVHLIECVICIPQPSAHKADYSCFETQRYITRSPKQGIGAPIEN